MSAGRANTAAVPAPEADPDVGRRVRARRTPPFNVNMASDSIVRTGDQIHAIRKKDVSFDAPAPSSIWSEISESMKGTTSLMKMITDANNVLIKNLSEPTQQAIEADFFLTEFKKETEDASKRAYELTKAAYVTTFKKEQERTNKRKRALDEKEKALHELKSLLDKQQEMNDKQQEINDKQKETNDNKWTECKEMERAAGEKQRAANEQHKAELQAVKQAAKVAALACLACYDEPRSMLMYPCTHLFYCQTCLASETLRHPGGVKCPVCRAGVTTSMRIHV